MWNRCHSNSAPQAQNTLRHSMLNPWYPKELSIRTQGEVAGTRRFKEARETLTKYFRTWGKRTRALAQSRKARSTQMPETHSQTQVQVVVFSLLFQYTTKSFGFKADLVKNC